MQMKESNHINMDRASLKKLSKSELIKLLLKQENKQVPAKRRPIPTPRKSVKEMVTQYEDNIIQPPAEFRDNYKPIPAPRTKKNAVKKPVPTPRTIIKQTDNALKGFVKSYEISIKNNKDPLAQLQNTRKVIEQRVINSLDEMKGLKYVETVKVTFNKPEQSNYRRDEITFEKHKESFFKLFKTDETDEKVSKTAYFNSKAQTIINHTEINKQQQNNR